MLSARGLQQQTRTTPAQGAAPGRAWLLLEHLRRIRVDKTLIGYPDYWRDAMSSFPRLGAAALVGLALLGPLVSQARAQRVYLPQSIAAQNAARPPGYIPPNRYYI